MYENMLDFVTTNYDHLPQTLIHQFSQTTQRDFVLKLLCDTKAYSKTLVESVKTLLSKSRPDTNFVLNLFKINNELKNTLITSKIYDYIGTAVTAANKSSDDKTAQEAFSLLYGICRQLQSIDALPEALYPLIFNFITTNYDHLPQTLIHQFSQTTQRDFVLKLLCDTKAYNKQLTASVEGLLNERAPNTSPIITLFSINNSLKNKAITSRIYTYTCNVIAAAATTIGYETAQKAYHLLSILLPQESIEAIDKLPEALYRLVLAFIETNYDYLPWKAKDSLANFSQSKPYGKLFIEYQSELLSQRNISSNAVLKLFNLNSKELKNEALAKAILNHAYATITNAFEQKDADSIKKAFALLLITCPKQSMDDLPTEDAYRQVFYVVESNNSQANMHYNTREQYEPLLQGLRQSKRYGNLFIPCQKSFLSQEKIPDDLLLKIFNINLELKDTDIAKQIFDHVRTIITTPPLDKSSEALHRPFILLEQLADNKEYADLFIKSLPEIPLADDLKTPRLLDYSKLFNLFVENFGYSDATRFNTQLQQFCADVKEELASKEISDYAQGSIYHHLDAINSLIARGAQAIYANAQELAMAGINNYHNPANTRTRCIDLLTTLVKQEYGKKEDYKTICSTLPRLSNPQSIENVRALCNALIDKGYGITETINLAADDLDRPHLNGLHIFKFHRDTSPHMVRGMIRRILGSDLDLFSILFGKGQGYDAAIKVIQERLQQTTEAATSVEREIRRIITIGQSVVLLSLITTYNKCIPDVINLIQALLKTIEQILQETAKDESNAPEGEKEFAIHLKTLAEDVLENAKKSLAAQEAAAKATQASSTPSAVNEGKESTEEKRVEAKEEKKEEEQPETKAEAQLESKEEKKQ
jgi:hypothetical protein